MTNNIARYTFMILVAVAAVAFTTSCSNSYATTSDADKHLANAASDEQATAEVTTPEQSVPQAVEGNDNSTILKTRDEDGFDLETRTFNHDQFIDRVVIKTVADNKKEGYLFTKNGEKLDLSPEQTAAALTMTGAELVAALGLDPENAVVNRPAESVMVTTSVVEKVEAPTEAPETSAAIVSEPKPEAEAKVAAEAAARAEANKKAEEARTKAIQKELTNWTPPTRN